MPEDTIKQLEDEIERLRHLVYYDELTGLLNRRGFLHEAGAEFHLVSYGMSTVERRVGAQIPFAVVFCDLDDFKGINDTHGHAAGDRALKVAATTLQQSLRHGDVVARWGGEEFVVALVGAGAANAERIAEKLRKNIEQVQVVHDGTHIPLTGSFGVASYEHEESLEKVIERADRAMYASKSAGKNRVTTASEVQ
ncbi:MAG: GGDEF domain-containing protein [Candidatus Yanofskybacteria bacterium]|nr:GGDEF domain-containing protein [Candidatus Yanofskybacteria bacterium]